MNSKLIEQIMQLGYDQKKAEEMFDTFQKYGGLSCLSRWPREFSFFSGQKNVLDILLENRLV